ncbi:protein kibra isoform X1 [Galleria mellonella]|uniref:Protein kibra isoform X1 n=1 Tax=Galleria mellonella TaxID=7137 RepID=A0ABM3MFD0_GALME|nr:protein kibra isoform X1 [Galleria mellonella]
MAAAREAGAGADPALRRDRPPKCARDCILSAARAHSTARHPSSARPRQSTRALLGVKMCPLRRALTMWSQPPPPEPESDPPTFRARAASVDAHSWCRGCFGTRQLARMVREPLEYGVRVDPTSARPAGLMVRDEPQYQNLEVLRKRPEYANLDEISREFGYRLCPEGQNLEDEAIYENILSVRQIRSAEVRLVPVSEVAYYEGQGYVATQVLSRNGTFPQCPPNTWSRLQHACRMTGSLKVFTAKKEMYDVKKQRLCLAQDEYKHLNNALSTLAASRTSLCSSTTSMTTTSTTSRHDPEVLRSEVAQARGRVAQLRKELRQARAEVASARRGVDTLAEVEQKICSQQGCYNITEAQAIMTELKNIQKSLTSGEKERADLMQSLAKLKDDLTRLQLGDASPDLSTLSLPQEKLSTASQTDLCADLVPIGTRLAEMARVRLQYDEARKRIQQIQQQLADLEDKVQPGQAESDKDRLLLFQEKEQLLRELRSITPRTRSKQEMTNIQSECERLEQDLKNAFEMSNKCIADRLRLHEEKQLLLQQLKDALTSMTTLEGQLKTLSASTLSVSSSSSLGSLSTASSKGSLSSGISFTDIYGGPQIASSFQADKPIDMADLHRRVERLLRGTSYTADSITPGASSSPSQPSLSPRSSLSSASPPPPPPSYNQVERQRRQQKELEEKLAEMRIGVATGLNEVTGLATIPVQLQGPGRPSEPLSPISETPSAPLSPRTPSSSGTNTRSVSAAVSDESVAGDSGVFEAAQAGNDATNAVSSAQIEIKLRYCPDESALEIGILRARNLHALHIDIDTEIVVRVALMSGGCAGGGVVLSSAARAWRGAALCWRHAQRAAVAGARALRAATLQINVCTGAECLGCAQVSLADFDLDAVSQKWYNLLSFRSMRRDESSDESTVISSQTSTLTRNRGPESMTGAECNVDCGDNSASEDEESREPLNQIVEEDSSEDYIPEEDEVLEEEYLPSTAEKATNTECNFCPEGARQLHRRKSQQVNANPEESLATIKRSQTFSPQPQSIGKGQYICRLNRSESDSSMAQYARRVTLQPPITTGIPFDRNRCERRSLRRGRSCALRRGVLGAAAAGGRSRAPRTSLDLALDLRAQHSRLADLNNDIEHLTELKKKLEEARSSGDPAVAAWVAEDDTFRRLITGPNEAGSDRTSRLLHKTYREIIRLRRSRQGSRKPDIVTFKEKMAFFTRSKATIPVLPGEEADEISEDDWEEEDLERRTPDGRSSKTSYERREQRCSETQPQNAAESESKEVVECKNLCLNPEPCYENLPITSNNIDGTKTQEENETKTEEVRYEFVVDRVLGVQV